MRSWVTVSTKRRSVASSQLVQAEIDDLYRRFLGRRSHVVDACHRTPREQDRGVVTKGACAVAGVVALAAGIEARRRHLTARQPAPAPVPDRVPAVSVRVPVALPDMQGR